MPDLTGKEADSRLTLIETDEQIRELTVLAAEIWTEHYTPIIGQVQVSYMLEKFQSMDAVRLDINSRGYRYVVAIRGQEWLGYSATRITSDNVLFLSKLYVKKNCRGQGVARILIADAKKQAVHSGCERIELTVNRHNAGSIAAYNRLGFAVVGEKCADIGNGFVMDDYVMSCPVKPEQD